MHSLIGNNPIRKDYCKKKNTSGNELEGCHVRLLARMCECVLARENKGLAYKTIVYVGKYRNVVPCSQINGPSLLY